MTPRRYFSVAVQLLLVLTVVTLLAGHALGQPVLLSFVETGSMEPTLDPGDGFVAIPAELTGGPERNDVVVFTAKKIEGGGLTTHRIVGETDRGYITQGDANPATDQAGSEPPVQEAQIIATVWQVHGNVVVIPHLGTAAMGIQAGIEAVQYRLAALLGVDLLQGTQGLAYLLAILSILGYVVDIRLSSGPKREYEFSRSRDTGMSMRLVVFALTALVVFSATMAMVGPAGATEFGIVSASFESERPTVIPSGETKSFDYTVPNGGLVPTYIYLDGATKGVDVEPGSMLVTGRSQANATINLTAPMETGYHPMYIQEHRYLAVLPSSVIASLHEFHPWAPIITIDLLLGGIIYVLGTALLGDGSIRSRRWKRTGGGWSNSP